MFRIDSLRLLESCPAVLAVTLLSNKFYLLYILPYVWKFFSSPPSDHNKNVWRITYYPLSHHCYLSGIFPSSPGLYKGQGHGTFHLEGEERAKMEKELWKGLRFVPSSTVTEILLCVRVVGNWEDPEAGNDLFKVTQLVSYFHNTYQNTCSEATRS